MIITPEIWSAWANLPLANPSAEYTSVNKICQQVDRSIKTRLKRTVEQQTFTGLILDAPTTPYILLQRYAPITIAGFQCWLNGYAHGNPADFDSTSLLTMYEDYTLDKSEDDAATSPGTLTRLGAIWGLTYRFRPYQLAPQFDPNMGAVKVSFTGGYETVPDDIVEAACVTISKVLGVRRYGMQVGSESWNGYSYNLPGVGMMINGLLGNPDIRGLLEPYVNYAANIG